MSAQNPSPAGDPVEGPRDPEHDPTASYALEPEYVASAHRPACGHDRARPCRGALAAQRRSRWRTSRSRATDDVARGVRAGPPGAGRRGRGPRLDERAAILLRLHDLVLDRQDEIIDLICWESGKARKHAFDEPLHIALTARYYARTAHEHLDTERKLGVVPGLTRVEVNRVPKGVVGIISPWNYPFTMALCDGLPALLAGNAVVAKPDAQTMLSALLGAQLLEEAGFPPDLWQVVAGPGRELGTPIDRARRLHLLHRLDRDRQADRQAVRRAADRLLARARRQEPDPGAARRRPREGRRGRRPGVASPTPASCASRWSGCSSPTRSTTGSWSGSSRRTEAMTLGATPRLGRRHGLADLARTSSTPSPRTSRTPSPRAPGCSPAARPGPTSARTSTSRPSSRASRPT